VKRCANRQRGGFAYQPGNGPSATMTAAGITALQVCGVTDAVELTASVPYLATRLPRYRDRYFFYGNYYSCVALHQHGGDVWENSKEAAFRELLLRQNRDGSWTAGDGSEKGYGKAYATSLAVLALTVEYGYLPIYQK
ncbi:MAG: prenyltransferase, partial [Planctomycetaceae bacterium]|nr:prenyltransferase [Planctomycetaceae bacterium]